MKKVLKFSALALGALGLVTGMSSCSKDDEDSNECCKASYTYSGVDFTIEACEDGSYTFKYGTETETGNWKDDGDYTWAELKDELVEDYGATCS